MNPTALSRRRVLQAAGLAALGALGAVAGCASAPQVRQDQDPTVDLRAYRTFAFYEPADERGRYASLIGRHLQSAAREQLERLQYRYSEQDPDLRVAMFLFVAEHPELRSTGRSYHGFGGALETVTVRDGSLRIDLVDTRRNALVWQGIAEGRVDDRALRDPAAAVHAAVAEIFQRYATAPR